MVGDSPAKDINGDYCSWAWGYGSIAAASHSFEPRGPVGIRDLEELPSALERLEEQKEKLLIPSPVGWANPQPALGLAISKSTASDQTRCNAGEPPESDLTSPTLSFIDWYYERSQQTAKINWLIA